MPLQRTYTGQTCSVAAALEIVGERWTMLIIREALLGVHRFDEMQADLGIARNVLQARLERLVANDILERRLYQERPERYAYHLTEKGLDLWPALRGAHAVGRQACRHPRGAAGAARASRLRRCRRRPPAVRRVWREARATRRVGLPADHVPANHPLRRRDLARS